MKTDKTNEEMWTDGDYGETLDSAEVSVVTSQEIDEKLDLQMISIRLDQELIRELKTIAKAEGVGYQPLIRRVLKRFTAAEFKKIAMNSIKENIEDDPEPQQALG